MKLTDAQQKALDRLKKALETYKGKPSEVSKALVAKHYDGLLRNTMSAEQLSKDEVELLQKALT